jgi:hypothetical protein
MVLTRRQVAMGEILPRWYGMAWINYVDGSLIAYPLPFNFLARFLHTMRWRIAKWFMWPRDNARDRELQAARGEGYRQGFEAAERTDNNVREFRVESAYRRGYRKGMTAQKKMDWALWSIHSAACRERQKSDTP